MVCTVNYYQSKSLFFQRQTERERDREIKRGRQTERARVREIKRGRQTEAERA